MIPRLRSWRLVVIFAAVTALVELFLHRDAPGRSAYAQSPSVADVPVLQWDPTWPKPLPETWAVGPVVGVAVDKHDHIWIVHRVSALQKNERYTAAAQNPPIAECCIPAPPILEFDQAGNLVSSWGGPGKGYEWPQSEHGIFVDDKDFVWTAGNGEKDAQILKFTHQGKFVLQIGRQGQSKGNSDTGNLGRAADIKVDPAANEVYVADGYGNRRIIVFDAESGAFKRMWGAYGNRPDDADIGGYKPGAPPAQQFRTAHGVNISRDGLVYGRRIAATTGCRSSGRTEPSSKKVSSRRKRFWRGRRPALPSPQTLSSDSCTCSTARTIECGFCLAIHFGSSASSASTDTGAANSMSRTTWPSTARVISILARRWKAAACNGSYTRTQRASERRSMKPDQRRVVLRHVTKGW